MGLRIRLDLAEMNLLQTLIGDRLTTSDWIALFCFKIGRVLDLGERPDRYSGL